MHLWHLEKNNSFGIVSNIFISIKSIDKGFFTVEAIQSNNRYEMGKKIQTKMFLFVSFGQ